MGDLRSADDEPGMQRHAVSSSDPQRIVISVGTVSVPGEPLVAAQSVG
jgi:hypothetical protein